MLDRHPFLFVGNACLGLVLSIFDGLAIFSLAPIIANLTGGVEGSPIADYYNVAVAFVGLPSSIEIFLLLVILLNLLKATVQVGINYYIFTTRFMVIRKLLSEVASSVLYASVNFLNRQKQGGLVNSLSMEVTHVGDAFTYLSSAIAPVIQIVVVVALPLYISWETTLAAVLVGIILTIPLKRISRYAHELGIRNKDARNKYSAAVQEIFSKARVVAGFGYQAHSIKHIETTYDSLTDVSFKELMLRFSVGAFNYPVGIIAAISAFFVGRHFGVPTAEIAVIVYAINRAYGELSKVININMSTLSFCSSYDHLETIRMEANASRVGFGDAVFPGLKEQIELVDVEFSYPGSRQSNGNQILSNVNIVVTRGKVTALVGASGAGKSTIADIFMGFQKPNSGHVSIDGQPIDKYDINSFRQHVGYVPQKNELFNVSIKDNLLWANPHATDKDIEEVCRLASIYDFIVSLPDGFDTEVGENGVMLSGGQLQRIVLARALIRKPDLLIMDEATSALDTKSEQDVRLSIQETSRDSAVLVIAHRLSTVIRADLIYVLNHGCVVEQGNFDDLMAKQGVFADLVNKQKF